jgi:hypothetical protein
MKKPEIYKKIDQHRQNKSHRNASPFLSFKTRANRSLRLLRKIAEFIHIKTLRNESLSQFVISDITQFEVYFKDMFLTIFDGRKDSKELLLNCYDKKIISHNFDFEDLVTVSHSNYTPAEILLQFISFQRLNQVNSVFSAVIGKDFFSTLKTYTCYQGKKNEFKLDSNCISKLQEYFDLRHNMVHDWDPKPHVTAKRIFELHINLIRFIVASNEILEDFLFENLKDELKGNDVLEKGKSKRIKSRKLS